VSCRNKGEGKRGQQGRVQQQTSHREFS
jgi:hypothetical protein